MVRLRITLRKEEEVVERVERPASIITQVGTLQRPSKVRQHSRTGSFTAPESPPRFAKIVSATDLQVPDDAIPLEPLEPLSKPAPQSETVSTSGYTEENSDCDEPNGPPQNTKTFIFEFSVEDTGPGIPQYLQQRVFEPFVQGDLRLNKRYGGTGLGLSICAQLTKLMHGSIELKSSDQSGSIFTAHIPLKFVKDGASGMSPDAFAGILIPVTKQTGVCFGRGAMDNKSNYVVSRRSSSSADSVGSKSLGALSSETVTPYCRANRPRLTGLGSQTFAPISFSRNRTPGTESIEIHIHRTNTAPTPSASDLLSPLSTGPNNLMNSSIGSTRTAVSATSPTDPNQQSLTPLVPIESLSVLVAEDNFVNQEVVSRMLKLEKVHNVTFAKDGQEAVDRVKEHIAAGRTFDLVFMDVQMPNLDGLAATRLIRGMGYMAPIVALTAFAEESNVRECKEAGMNSFLAKPIKRAELKRILRIHCRSGGGKGVERGPGGAMPGGGSGYSSVNGSPVAEEKKEIGKVAGGGEGGKTGETGVGGVPARLMNGGMGMRGRSASLGNYTSTRQRPAVERWLEKEGLRENSGATNGNGVANGGPKSAGAEPVGGLVGGFALAKMDTRASSRSSPEGLVGGYTNGVRSPGADLIEEKELEAKRQGED